MAKKVGKKQKRGHDLLLISTIIAAIILLSLGLTAFTTGTQRSDVSQEEKTVKFSVPTIDAPKEVAPAKTIQVQEKLPDLQIQLFSTYSGEIKQAIRITTDLMNKGDADITSNYKVTYGYEQKIGTNRVDYIQVGDYEVKGPHKAGITKPISFLWVPEKTGTYDFKVCADYANNVKESNDDNNCARSIITVKEFAKY